MLIAAGNIRRAITIAAFTITTTGIHFHNQLRRPGR